MKSTFIFPFDALRRQFAQAKNKQALYKFIVDAPFTYRVEMARLHLGIIVLLLANARTGMIDRVALSDTELAKGTTDISVKKFEDIKIPLDYPHNSIAEAIRTQQPQMVSDWQYLFAPALTPQEARFNQAGGGIACSVVWPFAEPKGALIFSYFQYPDQLGEDQEAFMDTYTKLAAQRLATAF